MQFELQKSLLIATNNSGKLRELQILLSDLKGVKLVSPVEVDLELNVEELGETYAENAALKAEAFAQASGLVTLADDSGLEVDALNGNPGLHSARYSPQADATDADRRAYLLENLADKPRPWAARFVATIAVVVPGGEVQFAEGICKGEIVPAERGEGGFGYDPIFVLQGGSLTMAELSEDEKNRVSHRAKAVHAAGGILGNLFN